MSLGAHSPWAHPPSSAGHQPSPHHHISVKGSAWTRVPPATAAGKGPSSSPTFSLCSTHLLGWNWLRNIPTPESIQREDKKQQKARKHRIIPGSAPLCPQAQHCFHVGSHEAHLIQTSCTSSLGWEPGGASAAGSVAGMMLPGQDRLPAGRAPAEGSGAAGEQSSARQSPPRGRCRQPGPPRQTVTQQLSQG